MPKPVGRKTASTGATTAPMRAIPASVAIRVPAYNRHPFLGPMLVQALEAEEGAIPNSFQAVVAGWHLLAQR